MREFAIRMAALMLLSSSLGGLWAQTAQKGTQVVTVPRLVRISNTFRPVNGGGAGAVESVTFSIYKDEHEGAPLWQETQNVPVDAEGRYTALLGSSLADGMPLDLFNAGEQRWLGIRFNRVGETEQPRVLLASVPYAIKASDADTLGGRPASAYLMDPNAATATATSVAATSGTLKSPTPRASSGNPGFLGVFTNSTDLVNSVLFQSGSGIGLNTSTPFDFFHVRFSDTTGGFTGYAVQNLAAGPNSFSGMLFYDQTGSLGQFQGFSNSSHEYRINNIASGGSINFMLGTSKFLVANSGNIGIGTMTPNAALQVATGDIYVSTAGSGLILKAPNGTTCVRVGIDNTGTLVSPSVTCP